MKKKSPKVKKTPSALRETKTPKRPAKSRKEKPTAKPSAFQKPTAVSLLRETTTLRLPPVKFREEKLPAEPPKRKKLTGKTLATSLHLREATIRAGGHFFRRKKARRRGALAPEMPAIAGAGLEAEELDDRTVMMGSIIKRPWNSVVVIFAEHPDPAEGTLLGSGFFIHQQILVTAGHVVYPHPEARSLRIYRPFPQTDMRGEAGIDLYPMAAGVWVHPEWLARGNDRESESARELDIGAIFFPSSFSLCPGTMPFNMNPADGFPVRVGGFPRDFPTGTPAEFAQPGTLVTGGGLIEDIFDHRLVYDAFTSVGESGGPAVCMFDDPHGGDPFEAAVGIHNYGLSPGRNAASRFTQDLIDTFNEVLKLIS